MSDNLRTRIAAVADTHAAMGYDSDYGPNDSWVCNCGFTWAAGGTHGEHVAESVIAELELSIEHHETYTGGDLRYFTIEGHFNEPI